MIKLILFIITYFVILLSNCVAFNYQITVNQAMSFGYVQYNNSSSIYSISENNILQSNNKVANYQGKSNLAKITIYGMPNDEVTLNFGAAKLVGNFGEITLSNIKTINSSNFIKLDNTGKATVELTGTVTINNKNLIGQYKGIFVVWASYKSNKFNHIVSQNVGATISITPKAGSVVKNLDFGTIVYRKNTSCSVTVTTKNMLRNSCISVKGAQRLEYEGTTILSTLPVDITILPSSSTIVGTGGDSLTIDDFNSSATKQNNKPNYTLYIGATLNIPATAKGGVYTGTYNVIILIL